MTNLLPSQGPILKFYGPADVERKPALPASRPEPPLATAAWHEFPPGTRPALNHGDIWLSRLPSGEPVGFHDDRHVLVASGTRGGKGASIIIPNLCLWPGSVLVIDPKGENAIVTARRRGKGSRFCYGMEQKVCILDPFGVVSTDNDDFADLKVAFNPLDALSPDRDESVDEAARIADAIIISETSADPFWDDSAKTLLKALMLHVASGIDYLEGERNLITIRHLLLAGDREARKLHLLNGEANAPSGLTLLFEAMERNPAFGGVVANAGAMFAHMEQASPRTLAGVFQSARTNTDFLDSPALQRCLTHSDFSLRELKTDPKGVSLYLSLPQRYMETHYRWLRMMTTLALNEMERHKSKPACGHAVLTILDEFPALRRMRAIENAAAQIAGFGVKLVFVVQTLAQLKDIYKDNWETLLANAGVKLFFCNDDHFTRDYVSRLIGECEVNRTTRTQGQTLGGSTSTTNSHTQGLSLSRTTGLSSGPGRNGGMNSGTTLGQSSSVTTSTSYQSSQSQSAGIAESIHKRPLLTPDEVGRLFGDRDNPMALALIAGYQPLRLKRALYFRDTMFTTRFDPHPDHPPLPTLMEHHLQAVYADRRKQEEARRLEKQKLDEAYERGKQLAIEASAREREKKRRENEARLIAKLHARRELIEWAQAISIVSVLGLILSWFVLG